MTAIVRVPDLAASEAVAPPGAASYTVEAIADLGALEPVWCALQESGVASPYQRYDWTKAYADAMAKSEGFEPRILVVRDAARRPCLILPLGIARRRGLAIAAPIGGKHANYHLPVIGAGAPSPTELNRLLREAGRRDGVDAYVFGNCPLAWQGAPNPLAEGGRPSPSNGYRLRLEPDCEAALKRAFSSETRKKLRKKEKKLGELGPVTYLLARSEAEVDRILGAFQAQKRARMRELGIANPFEDAPAQAFIRAAALAGLAEGKPAIELHAILVGERVVATFGAAVDASRCCGMFNSFDTDPEIARSSPGELLTIHIIRAYCRSGRTMFDLGVGEARYKNSICDEAEELVDLMLPVSARGRLYAAGLDGFQRLKRFVKQTPWAWRLVGMVRRAKG
jgi:CelD/BcsL family acetyltransferase involved in cellulose biosynthesis